MRNIYDIIKEQKEIIDIDIATKDLYYTIEYFQINEDYVEESIGDGIKKLANAVIEFIKKIINKIKQVVRSIINFFTGSGGNLEEKLNDQIAAANKQANAVGSSGAAAVAANGAVNMARSSASKINVDDRINKMKKDIDDAEKRYNDVVGDTNKWKEAQKKADQDAKEYVKKQQDAMNTGKGTDIDSLKDILITSTLTVKVKDFGPFSIREQFMNRLIDSYSDTLDKGLRLIDNGKHINAKYLFMDELFTGADEDDNIIDLLKEELMDNDKEVEFSILRRGKVIYEYIHNSHNLVKKFKKLEDEMNAELNQAISNVRKENSEQKINFYRELASVLSIVFNYLVSSTMKTYKICADISIKATNRYCQFRGAEY